MLNFLSQQLRACLGSAPVWYLLSLLILPTLHAQQLAPGVTQVGTLQHYAINESSGLIESRRYPGVYWTHNDGGEQFIFAINQSGQHLGAFQVRGANMIDWEAISTDFAGNLYYADIGINGMGRSHSAIHRAAEPNPADRTGPADVNKTWYVRFPVARQDCESFFVFNGYGYLITKAPFNGVVGMYRFNLADNSESILLESVANIRVPAAVGDAAISQDGNRLGLLTGDGLVVVHINGNPFTAGTAPQEEIRYENISQEGGTFTSNGFLATLDGFPQILLYNGGEVTGAPRFETTLSDIFSFVGRTVTFSARAIGFPAVRYEWRFNGQLISGQTSSNLVLTNITAAQAGVYTVTAINSAGTASSSARLVIGPRQPDVRITEVMSTPASNAVGFADWFELTNFDTVPADLSGWRFNDDGGGFADAFIISNLVIHPGESIIFVDDLSAGDFRDWWGESNMPPYLRIVRYEGSGLGFGAAGDSVILWNATSTNESQVVTSVTFGAGETGVSFSYNPTNGALEKSRVGVNGAFRAAFGGDVGSPGIPLRPVPPFFITPLRNDLAFVGGRVEFAVRVGGFPAPTFTWRFNGQLLAGQTNSSLVISNVALTHAGTYSVTASNVHGTATSTSRLEVAVSTVNLRVTEVMASPESNSVAFAEWWELTNMGTNLVDLSGWRFDDSSGTLEDAFVLPQGLTIAPREIIIFVASLSSNQFRGWWGNNVPAGTKIVTYAGSGLGFSGDADSIVLWTRDAISDSSAIYRADFGDSDGGVSLTYDVTTQSYVNSTLGENGAFRAASGIDIGSPGIAVITSGEPVFTEPLTDQSAFIGGTAQFSATVVASPPAIFTWRFNDEIIIGETNSTLTITDVTEAHAGVYELTASNRLGVATSSARLTIVEKTILVEISEVMANPSTNSPLFADWWELTNLGSEAINMGGWRFNDRQGGFTEGFTLPANLSIAPGESIVFVEDLSAAEFRNWWGEVNVPANVQIVTYSGDGLGLGAGGDAINLWDSSGTLVEEAEFQSSVFGVSLAFDPSSRQFVNSQAGINGAFRATNGEDVGSPGRFVVEESAPVFATPLQDQTVFEGSTLTLAAEAGGFPAPTYVWRLQGQVIPGEDSSTLVISNITPAQAGEYELTASNRLGTATTRAVVQVRPQTLSLEITEVMASPSPSNSVANTADWWELSNFGSTAVNLAGWRFDDGSRSISNAFLLPNLTIQPGESIIFVEGLTAAEFRQWWGSANVPDSKQIITYPDNGFGLSATRDSIYLWDSEATADSGDILNVAFGASQEGISLSYDAASQSLTPSQVGVNGAFRAANAPDVGSPGTVSVSQSAPVFTSTIEDTTVSQGETVQFIATASGFPAPTYIWRFNGEIISGQTFSTLTLSNVTVEQSGTYQVTASNSLGSVSQSAELTVRTLTVDLRVTEIMPSASDDAPVSADWWELTNLGSTPVNLGGWRFDDNSGTLSNAFIIPEITVQPGESIIFVDTLTPAEFRGWWGETNVTPEKQIITYVGNGLGLGASGDSIILWDNEATNDTAIYRRADFTASEDGVSLSYDPGTRSYVNSQLGVNGAFRAANGSDIGSPGVFINAESAPVFTTALEDTTVFESTTVQLLANASGSPSPVYSWRFNGELLQGQTTSRLVISNVTPAQAGTYSVTASNSLGQASQSMQLTVRPRTVDLRVTEVMSNPSTNSPVASDWWELSNFGATAVNLEGWRFDDDSQSFSNAFILPNVVIQPGESIVLVEDLTADEFRTWWGTANVPSAVQIVTYSGSGLGLGAGGDAIVLWDNEATGDEGYYLIKTFEDSEMGFSLTYAPGNEELVQSQLGVNGAFQAANGQDVGSPGREASLAGSNLVLTVVRNGSNIRIQFTGSAGTTYNLEESTNLVTWASTGDTMTPSSDGPAFFGEPTTGEHRFFRVGRE